ALGLDREGRTLQVACVYGDLTTKLEARSVVGSSLDVLDVLPLQLTNLARKLTADSRVRLIQGNSATMELPSASYDRALLFFLLHEQPETVRRATLAQALRVVRPGGKIVIVDYPRPSRLHPLHLPMIGILKTLEPYAMDLWRSEVPDWFPPGVAVQSVEK